MKHLLNKSIPILLLCLLANLHAAQAPATYLDEGEQKSYPPPNYPASPTIHVHPAASPKPYDPQQVTSWLRDHLAAIYNPEHATLPCLFERDEVGRALDIPMKDCYTTLALIEQMKVQEQAKERGRDDHETKEDADPQHDGSKETPGQAREAVKNESDLRGDRLASCEQRIYATKQAVELADLWTPAPTKQGQDQDQTPKPIQKLLLWGSAGIGKSTLCKRIIHRWQNNELWNNQFEAILLVSLRELPDRLADLNERTLSNLVANLYHQDRTPDGLQTYLEQESHKVLWILDGYDEIADQLTQDKRLNHLCQKLLNQPHVIITSRPVQQHIPGFEAHRTIENMGFSDQHIAQYVQNRFAQAGSGDPQPLLDFLRSKPELWGTAHVPINLEMFCFLARHQTRNQQKIFFENVRNFTTLYDHLLDHTCDIYKQHYQDLGEWAVEGSCTWQEVALLALQQFAYNGMISDRIQMPYSDLRAATDATLYTIGCGSPKQRDYEKLHHHIEQLGLLRTLPRIRNIHTSDASSQDPRAHLDYEFLHLSLQEYLAGCWIAHALTQPDQSDHAEEVKDRWYTDSYRPRYQLMWRFATGRLHTLAIPKKSDAPADYTLLNNWFSALWKTPHDPVDLQQMMQTCYFYEETSLPYLQHREVEPYLQQLITHLQCSLPPAKDRSQEAPYTSLFQTLSHCPLVTRACLAKDSWWDKWDHFSPMQQIQFIKHPGIPHNRFLQTLLPLS